MPNLTNKMLRVHLSRFGKLFVTKILEPQIMILEKTAVTSLIKKILLLSRDEIQAVQGRHAYVIQAVTGFKSFNQQPGLFSEISCINLNNCSYLDKSINFFFLQ